jgi:hypothetical protein
LGKLEAEFQIRFSIRNMLRQINATRKLSTGAAATGARNQHTTTHVHNNLLITQSCSIAGVQALIQLLHNSLKRGALARLGQPTALNHLQGQAGKHM